MSVAFRVCFAGSPDRGLAHPWEEERPSQLLPRGLPSASQQQATITVRSVSICAVS